MNVDERELTIDQQLQRVRRELLLRQTKTAASDGTLPIPDLVATALDLRRADQEKDKADVGENWRGLQQGPHLVFTGKYGTPDPRTLTRRFTARCDKAGLRHMTVHDARWTCATLLVDLEVHPRVIMRILRHADVSMTMEIYANQLDGHQGSVAPAGGVPAIRMSNLVQR